MKKSDSRKLLTIFSITLIALIAMMALKIQLPLSITETSCSGENVWIKYTLADENSRLSNLISDCKTNPAGGWVGEVDFEVESPSHQIYHIGGYQASPDSSQKINCGVSSQDGKTFAGGYVHNDGAGAYFVKVSGKYYLKSENYTTPHSFSYEVGKSVSCLLPSSTCPDGTALRTCSSVNIGKYCGADANLYDKAGTCGCPEGYEAVGSFCKVIPAEEPEEDVIDSPFGDGVDTSTGEPTDTGTQDTGTGATSGTNEVFYFGIPSSTWILVLAGLVMLVAFAIYLRKI